jgi:cytochrome P450
LDYLKRKAHQHGDAVRLKVANNEFILFSHPRFVEGIFIRNASLLKKDRMQRSRSSRQLFGNGLVVSHGKHWQHHRRLLQPAFRASWLVKYAEKVIHIARRHVDALPSECELTAQNFLGQLVLDIAGNVFFGVELGERTLDVGKAMGVIATQFSASGSWTSVIRRILPTPAARRYDTAVRALDGLVESLISEGRNSEHCADSLLGLMLEHRHENPGDFSDADVRDEALTMLVAGHETTAVALTWTLLLLAKRQSLQNEIRQEILRATPQIEPSQLPLLGASIKESLRLRPPAWILARAALEDFEVDGIRIRAGEQLAVSPWVLHHDARYFHSPDDFLPTRWSAPSVHSKNTYIPFGVGPRSCIGQGLANLELLAVLVAILRRFQVEYAGAGEVACDVGLTLRPDIEVVLALRELSPYRVSA